MSDSRPGPAPRRSRDDPPRRSRRRAVPALVALCCAGAGLALASQHPLSGPVAVALWLVCALLSVWRPFGWLALLPALLPLVGLMTWSGWMVVEELDLAVLAVAAGGYAAWAWRPPVAGPPAGGRALAPLLLSCFAVSLLISAQRGVADAGGWQLGPWAWWQGYHEPLNSLRLGKSFFLAMLLGPLWLAAQRSDADAAARRLADGLSAGLAFVGVLALWERAAFPGLLNFSTDYRITALFWEMHVGGAALDAYLALTMPFAFDALARARSRGRWALAAAGLGLGAYACLATFSRIVYIAVPAGIALLAGLRWAQRRRAGAPAAPGFGPALLLLGTFVGALAWIFGTSGYRGALALLGAAVALLLIDRAAAGVRPLRAAVWGVLLVAAVGLLLLTAVKGAYIAYAVMFGLLLANGLRQRPDADVALAGFGALLLAMTAVALHWGERPALERMLPVAGLLLAAGVATAARGRAPWPRALRWRATLAGTMAVAAVVVGTFSGGDYMGGRMQSTREDAALRLQHWQQTLDLMRGPSDWAFGKGLGRFPDNLFRSGALPDQTGDVRLVDGERGPHVVMTGGKHEIDWGQVFRLSQRVSGLSAAPAVLRLDALADQSVGLHVEICQKQLLYNGGCRFDNVQVAARPGVWQHLELVLPGGEELSRGDWYAPRLITFAIGVLTRGGRIEVDDVSLVGGDGRERLANGDFARGLARWYVSSDHHHLPWHEKNLALHVLFSQGWVGLALFGVLCVAALWRLSFGSARGHALAPPLTGALVGFFCVGVIDSLLDAPRIAFLFYGLLLVALTAAPQPRRSVARAGSEPTPSAPGSWP